ncbi:hypothetical protein C8R44DRAFT_796094 [Mycena epipterygia]|nr:hypothetical protein C8R44DRAFT_796094 [Mycena epipterygia]
MPPTCVFGALAWQKSQDKGIAFSFPYTSFPLFSYRPEFMRQMRWSFKPVRFFAATPGVAPRVVLTSEPPPPTKTDLHSDSSTPGTDLSSPTPPTRTTPPLDSEVGIVTNYPSDGSPPPNLSSPTPPAQAAHLLGTATTNLLSASSPLPDLSPPIPPAQAAPPLDLKIGTATNYPSDSSPLSNNMREGPNENVAVSSSAQLIRSSSLVFGCAVDEHPAHTIDDRALDVPRAANGSVQISSPNNPPHTRSPTMIGTVVQVNQGNYNKINNISIYSSADAGPPPPDSLLKAIEKNSQRLLPILGVATVFQTPPSVLQISRVLDLKWTEVRDALKPITPHLERLESRINHSSDVALPKNLKNALVQRTGTHWIDAGKYHGILARWCLTGKRTLDPRDITYVGEFWAHHVCNSNPTAELYDALRGSWLPLDPVWRAKLPGIIHWLEISEEVKAPDLLSTYLEHNSKPPEPVSVMAGMLNMLF